MLWVLKRNVSTDGSFEHPKHMLKLIGKKYLQFYHMLKFFIYLNLCLRSKFGPMHIFFNQRKRMCPPPQKQTTVLSVNTKTEKLRKKKKLQKKSILNARYMCLATPRIHF